MLALIVWLVPGGARASITVSNVLGLIFAGRLRVLRLPLLHGAPRRRSWASRIASAGSSTRRSTLIAIALIGTERMWNTGGGAILWLALIGLACWGIFTVFRAWRAY